MQKDILVRILIIFIFQLAINFNLYADTIIPVYPDEEDSQTNDDLETNDGRNGPIKTKRIAIYPTIEYSQGNISISGGTNNTLVTIQIISSENEATVYSFTDIMSNTKVVFYNVNLTEKQSYTIKLQLGETNWIGKFIIS